MPANIIDNLQVKPNTEVSLYNWKGNGLKKLDKEEAERTLEQNLIKKMSELQYKLFADKSQALLIILQGLSAAGKDSTVRSVMNAFNPQNCRAISFKVPSDEERSHDYLWRVHNLVPAKGDIAIFNRSHYEDIVEVRVRKLLPRSIWSKRYQQINEFENYLDSNNVRIIKLFLLISKKEQKRRLEQRIRDPVKQWKLTESDLTEPFIYDSYINAYQETLSKCSTDWAPWYIIPADAKWLRNYLIAQIIIKTLKDMKLQFPKPKFDILKFINS